MKTLLLDNSYLPVRIIDWRKAMILFLTGRAEVIEEYGDIDIRSISQSFKLPKVLRLFAHFKRFNRVKFSRHNVFVRDKFTCQYCLAVLKAKELTLDHVIPRSRGGKTKWENVVTSCSKCNHKKGSKLPEEFHLKLQKRPKKPNWAPSMSIQVAPSDPKEWMNWLFGQKVN